MALKRVYRFWEDAKEIVAELKPAGRELRELLGGKGSGLMLMTNAGIPVPQGFTITTDTCNEYYAIGKRLPDGFEDEVRKAIADLEAFGMVEANDHQGRARKGKHVAAGTCRRGGHRMGGHCRAWDGRRLRSCRRCL